MPRIKNKIIWNKAVLFSPRVLTDSKSTAQCSKFSQAKAGTVWNNIFKKHMSENESCIGNEKALKQMQGTDQLLTFFYYVYGRQSCNVKILWKNLALIHQSMAFPKGI